MKFFYIVVYPYLFIWAVAFLTLPRAPRSQRIQRRKRVVLGLINAQTVRVAKAGEWTCPIRAHAFTGTESYFVSKIYSPRSRS